MSDDDTVAAILELTPVGTGAPSASGTEGHPTLRVGDRLPAVLLLMDLAIILGVTKGRVSQMSKAGEFDEWELQPRKGNRPRFCGRKVQEWIDGKTDEAEAPKSRRRFFGAGSR